MDPLVICEWSLLFLALYRSTAQWCYDDRAIFSFFRLPFCLFFFSHLISLDAWPCIAGELHRVARHRRNWRSHQSWGNGNFHIFTILFQLRELVNQRKNNCVCVVSTRHHQLANLAHLVNPRVSFSTKVSSTTPQITQCEKVLLILPQSEIKSGEFRIS